MTPPPKKLAADAGTPWIGVHVITEFMFCPRAGLIAYELRQEDDGEDEDYLEQRPDLTYLPCYDLSKIEERLNFLVEEVKRLLQKRAQIILEKKQQRATILIILSVIAVLLLISLFAAEGDSSGAFIIIFTYIFLFIWTIKTPPVDLGIDSLKYQIEILKERRKQAQSATPNEPLESTDSEFINWWDLLAAGFESVSYREPLRDRKYRVAGRPWRVLRKGSLRIPVWRRKDENAAERRLKAQHYARMAAYCLLIEQVEGGCSPYGIILLGDSEYKGITVSKERSEAAFRKGLRQARSVISESRYRDPSPPDARSCLHCPNGKPCAYFEGESNARPGRLNSPVNRQLSCLDRRYYHSECGDRFRWLPPHEKAAAKDLRPN